MKHLFFCGLGLIILISFLTFSCQNEADKSDLTTTKLSFSATQFQEQFQKINEQASEKNKDEKALSTRGIIIPPISAACQPQLPPAGSTCLSAYIQQTVSLPPNPTCPVCTTATVAFTVRVCYVFIGNTPNYSFSFSNFGLAGLSPACEACLGNLPGHGADVVLDQISYQASMMVENDYVSQWVNTWHPPCSNNSYYSSDFTRQTCYRWCINLISLEISQLTCGDKCCQRSSTFCWEPLPAPNGTVRISPPVFQSTGASNCSVNFLSCNGLELPCDDRPCGIIP